MISLKITSTISQENQLGPTKIFNSNWHWCTGVQINWWNWTNRKAILPFPYFAFFRPLRDIPLFLVLLPLWQSQTKCCNDASPLQNRSPEFQHCFLNSVGIQGQTPHDTNIFQVSNTAQKSNWVEKRVKVGEENYLWMRKHHEYSVYRSWSYENNFRGSEYCLKSQHLSKFWPLLNSSYSGTHF